VNIDKLKIDGSIITVDYSALMESFRISTCDEAKPSLYQAAADVAILARVNLCLKIEGAGFFAIAFSNGDKPGTRLILSVPTATGDLAKVACPKLDRGEMHDFEKGIVIEDHSKTIYEKAVVKLLEEISDFVMGKRLQMALPFDQSPEERARTKEFGAAFAGMVGEKKEREATRA